MRVLLAILAVLTACRQGDAPSAAAGLGVAEVLGGGTADALGFARATAPPSLVFPADHGAHPDFRTEWWYVTANLATAAGRRFGIQLVFFRQALSPRRAGPPRAASLAAHEVILAHAAVTDVEAGRFHCAERLARAAGAAAVRGPAPGQPFQVFCGDWSGTAQVGTEAGADAGAAAGDGFLPLRLVAGDGGWAFDLRVEPGKPPVLQGDGGLSQKSAEAGNASIYYSLSRLPIAGSIRVDGGEHAVRGDAWLDREWSTSALGPEQVGWDWFSLQLDDGSELMWYRLRRRDGTPDPWSRGCIIGRDGAVTRLSPDQVEVVADGEWVAPDGGASYPARWRLRSSAPGFDLEVTPLLPDQELRLLVRYWEGAVAVRGRRDGVAVTGRGYLEMTGYVRRRP